ncbi:uncharacterized protein C630.12 isoform X3 [Pistacia vera]|uniref:uncharacterized protein C630.12 isoform X3 n=1 Tax=Pistacia vera TaxID=55513 RepID=UPI0012631A6B|nr:uncharacterized protein C630.12 isoform X3 [Pistacia vera]
MMDAKLEQREKERKIVMKQHQKVTVVLCLTWVLTLLYGEMFAFWLPFLYSCSWSQPDSSSSSTNSSLRINASGDFVKVAVLADPQLMDKTSHNLPPKSLALGLAQFYTDLFMRRAFLASVLPFKPDVILFLGDYFDGGPYLSDVEWQESLSRFNHIFGFKNQARYKDIPVYYLPGNHDIGYSSLHSHKPEVIRRYENIFGKRNFRFTVGKVEFISVDAQTLDDVQSLPRVLLMHIPLYRRDWTPCGPHRNSPVINQRILRTGPGQQILYQNYITEESSNHLLDLIKPVLVLSGHDHDQCTVIHKSKFGPIKEHTVGTISWQQGNLYPSFMLLSVSKAALLGTSSPEEAVSTHLCFLPKQTHIYIWYLSLFILTLFALLVWPTSGLGFWLRYSDLVEYSQKLMSCNIFKGGTKEKNEDELCEYEMIWDVEGSMHLIKKPISTAISHSSDRGTIERGNAVMRSTARKNVSQEIEVCKNMDMSVDDPTTKLPPKTSKSKTNFIITRLVRTFRMLTFIAAVNISLYMMLLFKDWIDI